jgi:hypothetical protein
MTDKQHTKTITNQVCAYVDRKRNVEVKLNFGLGFSAWFCKECATKLLEQGIGCEVIPNNG